MIRILTLAIQVAVLMPLSTSCARADGTDGYEDAFPKAGDPFMGNYEGEWYDHDEKDALIAAQILGLGENRYRITLQNLLDVRCPPIHSVEAVARDGKLTFSGDHLYGTVANERFEGGKTDKSGFFRLTRVKRSSTTLGAQPPDDAIVLFDGSDLGMWRDANGWSISSEGTMLISPGGADIRTADRYASVQLHLEFRLPYRPDRRGQDRGNSGVFLQNAFEVQILDSFGLEGYYNECGAVYKIAAPAVNVCRPPLEWQTYDITYRAPTFRGGELDEYGTMTVYHNGVLVHSNQSLPWLTSGGENKRQKKHPQQPAPIRLQEHGDYIEFRNIWLVELD